jgi:hypothetical protein
VGGYSPPSPPTSYDGGLGAFTGQTPDAAPAPRGGYSPPAPARSERTSYVPDNTAGLERSTTAYGLAGMASPGAADAFSAMNNADVPSLASSFGNADDAGGFTGFSPAAGPAPGSVSNQSPTSMFTGPSSAAQPNPVADDGSVTPGMFGASLQDVAQRTFDDSMPNAAPAAARRSLAAPSAVAAQKVRSAPRTQPADGDQVFDETGRMVGTMQNGQAVGLESAVPSSIPSYQDPSLGSRLLGAGKGALKGFGKGAMLGGLPGGILGGLIGGFGSMSGQQFSDFFGGPQPNFAAPTVNASDMVQGAMPGLLQVANQHMLGAAPAGYHYGWSPFGISSVSNSAPEGIQIAASGSGILGALGLAGAGGWGAPTNGSGHDYGGDHEGGSWGTGGMY